MADTFDIPGRPSRETIKMVAEAANAKHPDNRDMRNAYIQCALIYEAERVQQLSDCWDEAVISGHAHSFSDDVQPLELDEKAVRKDKSAYLEKITNTTSK